MTTQYLLNLGLLAFVFWANLGTRTVTRSRFTLPLLLVLVAGVAFLRNVPPPATTSSSRWPAWVPASRWAWSPPRWSAWTGTPPADW
jgi:hypothetical protein